ncbi:hypothetical protein DXG01_005165 [Tephrocybe rancida]|nr:hypothetical protein DXG01_005165 [Tephrocybe rancida]
MLAGVEAMLCHHDILQGVQFQWVTDHKGLIHLLKQCGLSGQQANWLEKIREFDFEVIYIPGANNVLADTLSRIYLNEAPGIQHSQVEYTYHNVVNEDPQVLECVTTPLLAGLEAISVEAVPLSLPEPAPSASPQFVSPVHHKRREIPQQNPVVPRLQKNLQQMKGRVHITGPRQLFKPTGVMVPDVLPQEEREAGDLNADDHSGGHIDVSLTGLMKDDSIDVLDLVSGKYVTDKFFRDILAKPKEHHNFVVEDNAIWLQQKDQHLLYILYVTCGGQTLQELVISEAHSVLAHLGATKTLAYLCDHVL